MPSGEVPATGEGLVFYASKSWGSGFEGFWALAFWVSWFQRVLGFRVSQFRVLGLALGVQDLEGSRI